MDKLTLHLVLKGQYYDMIESGFKPEEYRDIKNYWFKRLFDKYVSSVDPEEPDNSAVVYATIIHNIDLMPECIPFDTVTFQHGYSKDARRMEWEFKGIEIREGQEKWGAEKGKKYFVIKLGNKIESNG